MARGAGAALLLGAVLGGLEAWHALLQSKVLFGPMERLSLWGVGIASTGAVAASLGVLFSAVLGSLLGHDDEARGIALDTGRDPRYPWLPGVLAAVTTCVLLLQGLPSAFSGSRRTVLLLVGGSLLCGALFGVFLRWFLLRLDTTGKGSALAILGLPTILVITSSLVVSVPLAGGKGRSVAGRAGLPNLLLITIDGLRADHVGPGSRVRTPTLDWLAREGVYFRQASSPSTAEAPPVGSILSGRHPLATGFLADGQALPAVLPGGGARSGLDTLAEVLAREQFKTAAFVSSAAMNGAASGLQRGFEVYDDAVAAGVRGSGTLGIAQLWSWLGYFRRGGAPMDEVLRPAADTIERFEHWLAFHYRENLFAWLHLSDPLNPALQTSVDDSDLAGGIPGEQGREYGARVVAMDAVLGELVKSLETWGMLDRTVLAVVATRGVVPGSSRSDVSEPWTQVPVVLYGAGLDLQRQVDTQVRLHDFYPTLLTVVGLLRPPRGDAVSLVPLIQGKAMTPLQSLSLSSPRRDGKCALSLRSEDWKYVRPVGGGQSFYDLRKDPRELHDLSDRGLPQFEQFSKLVADTLGEGVPRAVVPSSDPGRAARLRSLAAR